MYSTVSMICPGLKHLNNKNHAKIMNNGPKENPI